MVGKFLGKGAARTGPSGCDAPRDVIRFAAGIDERACGQRGTGLLPKALGIVEHLLAEVTGVRVQRAALARDGLGYVRMAMADDRHIVVAVQETPPPLSR